MFIYLKIIIAGLFSPMNTISALAVENLALRQQLAVMKRTAKRPKLQNSDRLFWILLSSFWRDWRSALIVVKPDTVVRWHRKGFKLFWTWKSHRRGTGRPTVSPEVKALIRKMAEANPFWGAPRIHGELLKLGISISERTVSSLMPPRPRKPPSQTWRAFLNNHRHNLVSVDFFTVPTATFRVLFAFIVLSHDRRRVIHFNVTSNPTAEWTARQIIEAFPWNSAPKYLLRDRDSIYGAYFQKRVSGMGIEEVKTAPHSPWQNPYVERLIGSIRRDCLDHVIVLNEKHLRGILSSYFDYYHHDRTHCGLDKDTPFVRRVSMRAPRRKKIVALPRVGGLHHRYEWRNSA